jgi:hypothetical protein
MRVLLGKLEHFYGIRHIFCVQSLFFTNELSLERGFTVLSIGVGIFLIFFLQSLLFLVKVGSFFQLLLSIFLAYLLHTVSKMGKRDIIGKLVPISSLWCRFFLHYIFVFFPFDL